MTTTKRQPKKAKIQPLHYKKQRFLEQYAQFCVVGKAAEAVGVSRVTVYRWMEACPAFKVAFEDAKKGIVEKLEAEAMRRAHDGWDEPIYYKGELQGHVRKYSDVLLIFLLKGAAPEKYRERIEHTINWHEKVKQAAEEFGVPETDVWAELRELGIKVEGARL